jgi:hypothetical protein
MYVMIVVIMRAKLVSNFNAALADEMVFISTLAQFGVAYQPKLIGNAKLGGCCYVGWSHKKLSCVCPRAAVCLWAVTLWMLSFDGADIV